MEVEILSQKFIKPSIPTPSHRKHMKISFIDQLAPPAYISMIFYYSANNGNLITPDRDERLDKLERSLSETLTWYYPLAGKYLEEKNMIDCNDDGALFLEAKVDGQHAEIDMEGNPDPMQLSHLVPFADDLSFRTRTIPLAIQVNKFRCGGLAIGVCISHKLVDGISACSFVNAWATACQAGTNEIKLACFDGGSMFPAKDIPRYDTPDIPRYDTPDVIDVSKLVTKKFVFNGNAISVLKSKAMAYAAYDSDEKCHPSRVEVVTGLIWKVLIGVAQVKRNQLSPSMLTLSLNFRGRMTLPIPENLFGNLYRLISAQFNPKENKLELQELVGLVSDTIKKAKEDCSKVVNTNEVMTMVGDSMREVFERKIQGGECVFTSWCRFPIYEVDFGWGKPTWFGRAHRPLEMVVLVDTKCGNGIEAWVTLEEEKMTLFQRDHDIMTLASNGAETTKAFLCN